MSFINSQSLRLLHSLCLPLKLVVGVPENSLEEKILRVLNRILGPCRHTIDSLPILLSYAAFIVTAMLDWKRSISLVFGQHESPYPEVILFTLVRITIPRVKIAKLKKI